MKKNAKFLVCLFLVPFFFLSLSKIAQSVEMEADVGIEFTDIESDPPIVKPDPPIAPPKPPIKKGVQLPQTGEKKSQGFTIAGAMLTFGVGALIYRRKSGVTNQ